MLSLLNLALFATGIHTYEMMTDLQKMSLISKSKVNAYNMRHISN